MSSWVPTRDMPDVIAACRRGEIVAAPTARMLVDTFGPWLARSDSLEAWHAGTPRPNRDNCDELSAARILDVTTERVLELGEELGMRVVELHGIVRRWFSRQRVLAYADRSAP